MAKVYQEAGDTSKSEGYQIKFDKLVTKAEAIFEKAHKSKGDAEAYMPEACRFVSGCCRERRKARDQFRPAL